MDGTAAIDRLLALARVGPREISETSNEPAPYSCRGCEATFEVQYHVCPECGGFSVEPRPAALPFDGWEGDERVDDERNHTVAE